MLVRPLDAVGYHMGKYEWLDAVTTRYNSTLLDAPAYCDAHTDEPVPYTAHHALTCKKGGNRVHRHDTVQNALQVVGHKALGMAVHHVHASPWVLRQGQRDHAGKVCEAGLKGDLFLRGVHPLKATTIVDVRVVYPDGGENGKHETAKLLEHNEAMKRQKYQAECDARGIDFVPFVVTTDGAMGKSAQLLVTRLAEKLKATWKRPGGVARGWIKARLAIAIARASSACIRGCRQQPMGAAEELEIEIGDGAGVAPLMDIGSILRPAAAAGAGRHAL